MKDLTNLKSSEFLKKAKNIIDENRDNYKDVDFTRYSPLYYEKVAYQIIEEAYELAKENELSSLVIYDISDNWQMDDVIDILNKHEINDFILESPDFSQEDEIIEAILNRGFEAIEPVYLYRDDYLTKGYKFERV